MTWNLSRRTMMAITAGGAVGRILDDAMPTAMAQAKPERSPQGAAPAPDPANPAIGKPVSETAAAQEGKPIVPGFPKPKVGVALVGLGKIMVEEVLPALKQTQECEVRALVSGDRNKARVLAAHCNVAEERIFPYESLDQLAKLSDVDFVYIATPNDMHREHTLAAAKAGKHVLCEKPLATTVEDCKAMIDACGSAGKKLMTAYRVHHEPINQQMRAWVREKKYGRPHFVVFDAVMDVGKRPQYRLEAKRNGGGSLFDLGIYPLNTTCWLLGEEPEQVQAMQWSDPKDSRFQEVEENIAFQMRFPSGCIASCTSSFGTERVNRYRVMCPKGWFGMDPATNYRGLKGFHGEKDEMRELHLESTNQFAAELDHFARVVRDGEPLESPGEEGLRDVRLMLAIYESAQAGKAITV